MWSTNFPYSYYAYRHIYIHARLLYYNIQVNLGFPHLMLFHTDLVCMKDFMDLADEKIKPVVSTNFRSNSLPSETKIYHFH